MTPSSMMLKSGIILGGIVSLLVANGHAQFYKFFGWRETFKKVSLLDGKVFYTVNLFLIPLFLLAAYLSFFHTSELALVQSTLARDILLFYSLFWLCRALWQIVYFRFENENREKRKSRRVDWIVFGASITCFIAYATPLLLNSKV